jgi:hypothetical protein
VDRSLISVGPATGAISFTADPIVLGTYTFDVGAYAPDRTRLHVQTMTLNVVSGSVPVQTDLSVSGANVAIGSTVWATAFERYLSRDVLLSEDPEAQRLEEYSYRITNQEFVSGSFSQATLRDPQSVAGYTPLNSEDQNLWYDSFPGGREDYRFSWVAFLCLDLSGDQPSLSQPSNVRVQYTSLEYIFDGNAIDADENARFRNLVSLDVSRFSASTLVGAYDPGVRGVWDYGSVPIGYSRVVGDCAAGSQLEGIGLLDEDDILEGGKSLQIGEKLRLASGFGEISSAGVTIGVTGFAVLTNFDAALWGITTIRAAGSSGPVGAPDAGLTLPPPGSDAESTELSAWTKRVPGAANFRMYAKNVIGAGKVQFFVNGREVAWVRAVDSSDPKLRVPTSGPMAGVSYLVRTVPLVAGKNVIEIYVDGERVRRVAYSR